MRENESISWKTILTNWPFWTLVAILITWGSTFFIYKLGLNKEQQGQFGDMFGAVNALFSGFAFWGLIITVRQQKEELELQRNELKETKEEFRIQNETLSKQRFENTFFQMIELHHKTVDRLNYQPSQSINTDFGDILGPISIEGRTFLQKAHQVLSRCYQISSNSKDDTIIKDKHGYNRIVNPNAWEQIQVGYEKFYYTLDFGNRLSHYFMTLYHIFKLIYQAEYLSESEKSKYASIARAQLSQDELFILIYNSMYDYHGNPNFLFLMAKYKIHENFDFTEVDKFTSHMNIYYELIEKVQDPSIQEIPEPVFPD